MATITNIFVDQGSTFQSVITVLTATGMPMNLTGYSAAAQMRKSYQSSLAHTFTCEVLSPATAGQIKISMTATQTEAIAAGRWLYDVEISNPVGFPGYKKRVVEGIAVVTPQITQV